MYSVQINFQLDKCQFSEANRGGATTAHKALRSNQLATVRGTADKTVEFSSMLGCFGRYSYLTPNGTYQKA